MEFQSIINLASSLPTHGLHKNHLISFICETWGWLHLALLCKFPSMRIIFFYKKHNQCDAVFGQKHNTQSPAPQTRKMETKIVLVWEKHLNRQYSTGTFEEVIYWCLLVKHKAGFIELVLRETVNQLIRGLAQQTFRGFYFYVLGAGNRPAAGVNVCASAEHWEFFCFT